MRERKLTVLVFVSLLIVAGMFLAACSSSPEASLDGKAVLEERCVECHNLSRVKSAGNSREGWSRTLDRMISLGAELNSEEYDLLLDYLEATYP